MKQKYSKNHTVNKIYNNNIVASIDKNMTKQKVKDSHYKRVPTVKIMNRKVK